MIVGVYKQARRAAVVLLLLYLIALGALLLFEDRLVYRPGSANITHRTSTLGGLDVEDVYLATDDGLRLHALACTASDGCTAKRCAVLYLHGNRGNISRRLPVAAEWLAMPDVGLVLLVDYRGFGNSEGTPSEAGLYADADVAWRWLVHQRQVRPDKIVVVGRSLGGAVAVNLALARPIGAVVLENTFCTLPEVVQDVVPFAPCRWLMHNRYPTIERIGHYNGPLVVAHGREDELISPEHGRRLFEAANAPKRFIEVATSRHIELPTKDYYRAVSDFLVALAQRL
jgi:hypothetical protein